MSRTVLFVAGPVGAGKSTLAKALSHIAPQASTSTFSRGLRRLGAHEGVQLASRDALQNYGETVARERWLDLWKATVASAALPEASNLVIDGLRHPHILQQVRQLPDVNAHLLTLWPSPDEIARRRFKRGDSEFDELHIVESRLLELAEASDVVLRGRVANTVRAEYVASLFESVWVVT